MNKYYKLIMIPAIILILFGVLSGFRSPSEEKEVEDLIRARTSILQQTHYGKITKEQGISKLQEIEVYPLYNEDVYQLDNFKDTEFDMVRSMKIKEIWDNKNIYNYKVYKCKIQWEMRGLEGNYDTLGMYHIVIKKDNDKYKLSEFQLKE